MPCGVTLRGDTRPARSGFTHGSWRSIKDREESANRIMISSSGKHYANLDHVWALAAFMVFSWHFLLPEARAVAPIPPFSLFAEGHTGVALFMTLSGYLFYSPSPRISRPYASGNAISLIQPAAPRIM